MPCDGNEDLQSCRDAAAMELARVGPGEPDLRRSPRAHAAAAAPLPTWQELDEHRRTATFIHSRMRRWSLTRLFLAAVKANCNFLSTSLAFTNRAAMLVFMALAILYGAALVVVVQLLRVERLQWQYEGLQAQVRRRGRAPRAHRVGLPRTQRPLTYRRPYLGARAPWVSQMSHAQWGRHGALQAGPVDLPLREAYRTLFGARLTRWTALLAMALTAASEAVSILALVFGATHPLGRPVTVACSAVAALLAALTISACLGLEAAVTRLRVCPTPADRSRAVR